MRDKAELVTKNPLFSKSLSFDSLTSCIVTVVMLLEARQEITA